MGSEKRILISVGLAWGLSLACSFAPGISTDEETDDGGNGGASAVSASVGGSAATSSQQSAAVGGSVAPAGGMVASSSGAEAGVEPAAGTEPVAGSQDTGGEPAAGGQAAGGTGAEAAQAGLPGEGGAGMTGAGGEMAVGGAGGAVAFRFARLVAETSLNGEVWTSIAEIDLLDDNGAPMDRSAWTVSVDSEELVDETAPATNAIDGDPTTYWHTEWSTDTTEDAPLPHEFIIDMGRDLLVTGFVYLPRQDRVNGRIGQYSFYLSVDGIDWGSAVAAGTFPDGTDSQQVIFAPP